MSIEDFVPNDATVITMTRRGYIKRMSPDNFRVQNRGGKGIRGMQTIEDDVIENIFTTTNHKLLLFFTNKGRVYKLKAYQIPEASRTSRGIAIVNLLMLQPEEKIQAIIPIDNFDQGGNLIMATVGGTIKKTPLKAYENIRKIGIQAITLRDDDSLVEVNISSGEDIITMVTAEGMSITFNETDVRETGRSAMGGRGMNISEGDRVVGMQIANAGTYFLFITEKGMGKRTVATEFRSQKRGGKGLICYRITEKTGALVGMKAVEDDMDVIMITDEGIIIRTGVDSISVIGRNTSGVKCMNIKDENISVASIAVTEKDNEADTASAEENVDGAAEDKTEADANEQ